MDYIKLQNDLMKASFNRDKKGKLFNGVYLEREYDTIVGFNGSAIYCIYNDELYINCEKVFAGRSSQNFKNVVDGVMNSDDYEPLTNTRTIEQRKINGKKAMLYKYNNSKGDIYINKDLLKYFDMERLVLIGGDNRRPIRAYEDNTFVGIVCPTVFENE